MLRLLFALGPSAALHSTYTSLLISQTPAVCQLILTFSKSITPLSKVSVPANLYCAQTYTHTLTQYYTLTLQKKVNERESLSSVSLGFCQLQMMEYKFHLPHFTVLCLPALSICSHTSHAVRSGHALSLSRVRLAHFPDLSAGVCPRMLY